MKGKLFLVAMLVIGLVVGMAALGFVGCETDTTSASTPNNGCTIVLRNVNIGGYVTAQVFPKNTDVKAGTPVGDGSGVSTISGGEGVTDVAIDLKPLPLDGSFSEEVYQVTIKVGNVEKYVDNVSLKTSDVTLDWQYEMTSLPEYGFSLIINDKSVSEDTVYTFEAEEGYTELPPALSVDVRNTGNRTTGPLTVNIVSSTASFTLLPSPATIEIIEKDDTRKGAFSVQPNGGLKASTYYALVEVTDTNSGIKHGFSVIFTVSKPGDSGDISTGISLIPSGNHDFGTRTEGYTDTELPNALSVSVKNTSAEATGKLTVTVSPSDSFALLPLTGNIDDIPKGETKTGAFSVQPKGGLKASRYTAQVEVRGDEEHNISGVFLVSFTVKAADVKDIETADPAEVKWGTGTGNITYTGQDALGPIAIPPGKKLIITKEVVAGADDATANKITVENGAELEINAGASIDGTITIAAAASGGKAGTVTNNGTINLGTSGTITNNGGTVTNNGTVITSTTTVSTLKTILDNVTKNITASGNINVTGTDTTIKDDTILTISGKLTIAAAAKLTVIGSLDFTTDGTLVNNKGGTIEVPTEAKLAAVLNLLKTKLNGNVTVNKTTVTLSSSATIPQNVTLMLSTGQTLNVSEGTLTVSSDAKLVVEGGITVDGTITVESGGVFEYLKEYDTLWATSTTGSLIIKKGGKVYTANGSQLVSDDEPDTDEPDVVFQLTGDEDGSDSFTLTKGGYALDGAATLHSKYAIPANKVFSLSATSVLTIDTSWGGEPGDPSLTISAGASITGGEQTGAQIIVSEENTITISDETTSNFYNRDFHSLDEVTNGTYTWTELDTESPLTVVWLKTK
jgi:hypothetical protein